MTVEGKLIPVLREGITIIKMIIFKQLKPYLSEKYPALGPTDISRLSGAIINDIFGTPNTEPDHLQFAETHHEKINRELNALAAEFKTLRIPLTDALRIQFLCDTQDGIENEALLTRARDLGILITDRDVPLPKFFMNSVRRLGVAFNLLAPEALEISDLDESEPDETDANETDF